MGVLSRHLRDWWRAAQGWNDTHRAWGRFSLQTKRTPPTYQRWRAGFSRLCRGGQSDGRVGLLSGQPEVGRAFPGAPGVSLGSAGLLRRRGVIDLWPGEVPVRQFKRGVKITDAREQHARSQQQQSDNKRG